MICQIRVYLEGGEVRMAAKKKVAPKGKKPKKNMDPIGGYGRL
jgi:hypothetical protein